MHIAVLVKVVPDTYGERRIALETGLVDRTVGDTVVDEIGERAVEAALTLGEAIPDTRVTVVSMGPPEAADPLRKTLAMGADGAVHIADDALVGADLTLTAEVLAAAVRRLGPDLVLLGNVSTDGGGAVLGAMLAEHLGFAQITNLNAIESDGTLVRGTRVTEQGTSVVEAELPAVASITEALPDPRFPSMRNVMSAKRKPVETLTAAELGADVAGEQAARALVIAAAAAPARAAGTTVVDEGDGGRLLAEFLIARGLV
ncbi:MAG TPA: electron transfer flavoprotein subunit beta/FixA family protein [Gryllotalpicola sp.]